MASVSIATTQRCRERRFSFSWIVPLYPLSEPYNAACLASSTMFWVFDMTRPGTEPRFSGRLVNTQLFRYHIYIYNINISPTLFSPHLSFIHFLTFYFYIISNCFILFYFCHIILLIACFILSSSFSSTPHISSILLPPISSVFLFLLSFFLSFCFSFFFFLLKISSFFLIRNFSRWTNGISKVYLIFAIIHIT